jgi:CBS domain-containing protein/sporulation protein YlmC with PRC-barrel domain
MTVGNRVYNFFMIYFSELQGKPVYTEDEVYVGTFEDFIFYSSEKANITKIVIRNLQKNRFIIPIEYLIKLNGKIIIKKEYNTSELQEGELFILRNILDKQIIDIVGHKVVRVNDVFIQDENGLCITGVDIGLLGLLRRLKLEDIIIKAYRIFNIKLVPKLLSWTYIQPLELTRGKVKLKKEEGKLAKIRPEDLAEYLGKTNIANTKKILKILDEKHAASVIGNLNVNYQIEIFKNFSSEKSAKILSLIDIDEAVDILLTFSKKRREEIIQYMNEDKKKEIYYLLTLSTTPIGEVLTTEYLVVSSETTVKEVMDLIKKQTVNFKSFYCVYIKNNENQIVGVFNLHELLLQDAETPVYKFMIQNVIVIHLTTPQEIIIKKMLKYKLIALPVIDKDKHILGIVTTYDVTESILQKFS